MNCFRQEDFINMVLEFLINHGFEIPSNYVIINFNVYVTNVSPLDNSDKWREVNADRMLSKVF